MVTKKKEAKKKIFLESILVFFIAIAPFIYKTYEYLPLNADGSISFLWFTIEDNGFQDASFYVWFLTSKIVPLYLFIFWFLTSRDWWYHIIIIPIAMYAFQLFELIFDSDLQIDTDNIWWIIPVCMVTIPFVYFIRIKLYDKHVHGIDLEAMDAELEELKKKGFQVEDQNTSVDNTVEKEDESTMSLADKVNTKLSTNSIETFLKGIQDRLQGWLNFKF
ncbi:hypothetical protein SAMN04488009_2068 [Maribacter sedimenticola]|uniref:Uncharacterized protein n=1 Tax=Maribacter sedimenticola TaxID=228956 RepID=A0ABY1SHK5_9FLAO|nr:hypothetical protein [Maribacter sedimenticola]SNR47871.1 hypothetical protein SAMN04488009_2068 [Maribacter sedimenticola]